MSLAKTLKRTRMKMLEVEIEATLELFSSLFGLSDGDYISYNRLTSQGSKNTVARIACIDSIGPTKSGWKARVKVFPLLTAGNLGGTKTLTIFVDKNKDLTTWGCIVVHWSKVIRIDQRGNIDNEIIEFIK